MDKLYSSLEKLSNTNTLEFQNSSYQNKFLSVETRSLNFSDEVLAIFEQIYSSCEVDEALTSLKSGEIINDSDNKAVSHLLLRNKVIPFLEKDLPRIKLLKDELIEKNIKNIIILGIGGSYEGPKLLLESFNNFSSKTFNFIFITGSDSTEFIEKTKNLSAQETVFFISSKSLTTTETLEGFELAKNWLGNELKTDSKNNFFVITANEKKAKESFLEENSYFFDNGIGGRYSIWSVVSLPAILHIEDEFLEFQKGGALVDSLISEDKAFKNLIKKISFLDIWNNNLLDFKNRIILAYSWPLRSLPDYYQQLEMESLGKSPGLDSLFKKTSQTIFGGYGPKAQHSYFQQIHQGTSKYCIDLISNKEDLIKSNLVSKQLQAQKILFEKSPDEFKNTSKIVNANALYNHFEISELNAFNLGFLIALWEYRTFISAKLLKINPFDQFGVEAGKKLTKEL